MEPQMRASVSKITRPCAACKMLRRRCGLDCLLAPYFPMEEVESFVVVHKVFGASNAIKMLQVVEETKREDAVKSMVYEAKARLRDPVYGSVGAIFHLQKHVEGLLVQLESTRARLVESQGQMNQLVNSVSQVLHPHPTISPCELEFERSDIIVDDRTIGCNLIEFPLDYNWEL